jgi:hypothetical protein
VSSVIGVEQRPKGEDVISVAALIVEEHGSPKTIKIDYDSEFISKEWDR